MILNRKYETSRLDTSREEGRDVCVLSLSFENLFRRADKTWGTV